MSDLSRQLEGTGSSTAEDTSIELPPELNVVFYNDDFTTKDFVVEVLISIFNKPADEAEFLMETVHEQGVAVIGKYTFDIAVSRVNLTKAAAKKNNFPLRVEIQQ